MVQWNFYAGDWSFFPEAGVAIGLGFGDNGWVDNRNDRYGRVYSYLALGLGLRYHFSSDVALLLRVGNPGGLQIGVVF